MSDGQIVKRWEVHCVGCGIGNVGLRAHGKPEAIRELREDGWRIRGGLWCCFGCADVTPRGQRPAPDVASGFTQS